MATAGSAKHQRIAPPFASRRLVVRAQQAATPVIGDLGFELPEGFATRLVTFRRVSRKLAIARAKTSRFNTLAENAALRERIFSRVDVQNISLYFQWLFGAKHSAATEGPLSWTLASTTKKLG